MVALVDALAHCRSRPETSRPSWRARSGVTGLRPNERVQRVTACSADLSAPHAQSVMTGENQHHNQALGRSRHRDRYFPSVAFRTENRIPSCPTKQAA